MNFVFIIIIAIILTILFVLSKKLFTFLKHSTATTFIVQYNLAIDSGKTEKEAILNAIKFFQYREPFNRLDEIDVQNILTIALGLTDPLLIAGVFQKCDEQKKIDLLTNRLALEKFLKGAESTIGYKR
ncbi:MAG: hypothetical protein CEN87_650 [Parcubacteria group bacterium Licking1014_1]|nr:MAG: hypothetical protein CEN87_650 [Parcubacteria group bacterium Licking1014_1]